MLDGFSHQDLDLRLEESEIWVQSSRNVGFGVERLG